MEVAVCRLACGQASEASDEDRVETPGDTPGLSK